MDQRLPVQSEPDERKIHTHQQRQADVANALEKACNFFDVNFLTACV